MTTADFRDWFSARHEAAHLLAAIRLDVSFESATIEPHEVPGLAEHPEGEVVFSPGQPQNESLAVVLLAGLASSEIVWGNEIAKIPPKNLGGRHDVVTAAGIIKHYLLPGESDEAQEQRFLDLMDRAERLLTENAALWDTLTDALLAQRTLDRAAILALAAPHRGAP